MMHQSLLCFIISTCFFVFCYSSTLLKWNSVANVSNWEGLAISSNGKYLAATVYSGHLYFSKDYGSTWKETASTENWVGIGMSYDGKYISAVTSSNSYNGSIFLSSDYGQSKLIMEIS